MAFFSADRTPTLDLAFKSIVRWDNVCIVLGRIKSEVSFTPGNVIKVLFRTVVFLAIVFSMLSTVSVSGVLTQTAVGKWDSGEKLLRCSILNIQ